MINKKRLIKSLIIISLIIIIIFATIQIRQTLARYETTTTGERDVDVAFWVVDNSFKSQRLILDDIYPVNTPFEYTFTVSNFDPGTLEAETDDKIAETDMEYEIVLTTTTNLPLQFEITRNGTTYTAIQERLYTVDDETVENPTVYRELKFGTTANPYPLLMNTIVLNTETGKYEKTKVTDTYILKVTFPEQSYVNGTLVNNRADLNYPDLMELVNIDLSARQVVGD